MNKIILSENVPNPRRWTLIVSDRTLKNIEDLEYLGDFKRFSIDLYDDNELIEKKTAKRCVDTILDRIFKGW